MKSSANVISISRMLFALALPLTKPLSIEFFSLYLVCGFSDVLDGYIARKTNATSKWGEKIDSLADLVMVLVVLIVLYPIIIPTIQYSIILWVVVIGIIRTVSMMVVFVKYKTFQILHTYTNKTTGIVLFAFPLSIPFFNSDLLILIVIICVVATISAVEELLIHLLSTKLQPNKKGLFIK